MEIMADVILPRKMVIILHHSSTGIAEEKRFNLIIILHLVYSQVEPDYRKIQPRAPKQWKRTRPFKEKFVSGFQRKSTYLKQQVVSMVNSILQFSAVAPSRRSCEWTKDPLYLYEAFENHSRIGQGSFGMVYKVTCKQTEEKCAVKVSRVNGIYNW